MGRTTWRWIALAIVAAAIGNELRKPAPERAWHDRLFGFVPYDFRRPTFRRFKDTVWNTNSDRVLVPQVFGVGWSVNLGGLLRRAGVVGRS